MKWNHLELNIMSERYKLIKNYINSENIIDLGNNNHLAYFKNIKIFKNKNIITIDPLIVKNSFHNKINIKHFKGKASDFTQNFAFKKRNYNLIIYGLNIIDAEENFINTQKEIKAICILAAKSKRIFLEYPVNFWQSKIEAELLISLFASKILFYRTKEYNKFPVYAKKRNFFIFDTSKKKDQFKKFIKSYYQIRFSNYIFSNIRKNLFQNFETSFDNLRISSSLKYNLKIILNKLIFIFGLGKPWSYVLTLYNDTEIEKNYKLNFFGIFKNLLISLSVDNQNITHEISLKDLEDKTIRIKILPKETAIIRLGQSSLFLFLILILKKNE